MRVVIILDRKLKEKSGIKTVIDNTIPFFKKRKISVKFKFIDTRKTRLGEIGKYPYDFALVMEVIENFTRLLKDKDVLKADILHLQGIHTWLPGIFLGQFLKKTIVVTLHETKSYTQIPWFFGEYELGKSIFDFTIKNANKLIDVSGTTKGKNIIHIPNGVSKFYKPLKAKKKRQILFVGRLRWEKGVDILLKAFKILQKKDKRIKLLFCTPYVTNRYKPYLKKIRAMKNASYKVGGSNVELRKIYNQSSIVVMPSRFEAFGLVALEAMACGTPVIGAKVGGLAKVIKHNKTGLLVKPEDPKALANAILDLLNNDKKLKEFRQNCVNEAKKYDWEGISNKIIKVYYSTIK